MQFLSGGPEAPVRLHFLTSLWWWRNRRDGSPGVGRDAVVKPEDLSLLRSHSYLGCVTSAELLNFSEPQFPHLSSGRWGDGCTAE